MNTSKQLVEFLKQWEGLRLKAYRCPSRRLTIGYGHTGPDVDLQMEITPEKAEELLIADIEVVEKRLSDALQNARVHLTPGQFNALTSLAFNIGTAALLKSTLWRKLISNPSDASIPNEFTRWVYGGAPGNKHVIPGLLQRRRAEQALFLS